MLRVLINIQIVVSFYICLASAQVFFVSAHSGSDVKEPFRMLKYEIQRGKTIGMEELSAAEENVYSTVKMRTAKYDQLALKLGCAGLLACILGAIILSETRERKINGPSGELVAGKTHV